MFFSVLSYGITLRGGPSISPGETSKPQGQCICYHIVPERREGTSLIKARAKKHFLQRSGQRDCEGV